MKLQEIINGINILETKGNCDLEISNIHIDSRKVEENHLFVAVKGTQTDGHAYISKAIEKGAKAIVCETFPEDIKDDITYIKVANTEDCVGKLATAFYGDPTSKLELIGVTGTNGKTTTTALLGEIMKADRESRDSYDSVFVVGNIGNAYTGAALSMTENSCTVAEISSFQLETTEHFSPDVSGILNITEDHLNRHHTMEEYIRVKELIAAHQTKDSCCVLNYEDSELREYAKHCPATPVFFSSVRKLEKGIFLDGDRILLRTDEKEIEMVRTGELKLLGQHNYENVMAACAMAYYAGVPVEVIHKAVTAFKAVAHRIEFVDEIDGVAYYNDSKGTNPDAAIKGIQAMNRPTLLIGGGYDKESSYEEWIRSFDGKVKYLVLIGQTREKIQETAHACGFENTILADNLEEAVKICASKAVEGDAVLLSPACASWGQFDNYEQRGDKFKEYVLRMKA